MTPHLKLPVPVQYVCIVYYVCTSLSLYIYIYMLMMMTLRSLSVFHFDCLRYAILHMTYDKCVMWCILFTPEASLHHSLMHS